jgi:putative DNA primase/helicase
MPDNSDDDFDAEWEAGFNEACDKAKREHDRPFIEAEIARLAKLPTVEYERERKNAADRLEVRATILDRLVQAERPESPGDGQGRAVRIADVEPWPDRVDGNAFAGALVAAVKSHVVLRDDQADAIAFWILHTWLVNEFSMSPRLAVTSPTKGCGKTTVLRLLNILARRPKRTGSISPSALFRAVEMFQPTVLLDETEKFVEHGSDLHALLNEGHCKEASVMRVLGENLELREFAVYGAAAFARNGAVPDDLDQRSIVIELQRRKPDEPLDELRDDRCEPLRRLARMCSRWAEDHAAGMRDHDPDMGGLINRGADNWRPLFTVADTVGGDWPGRIRAAAARLAPREANSHGVVLLGDIKATFADKKTDRLWSEEIAEAVHAIEGRPWAEWGRAGKPISKNQIARILKDYKIVPDSVRVGERTKKGYHLSQFAEAFERYLGPQGVNEPEQRNKPTAMGTSSAFQNGTGQSDVPFQKCEKPLRPSDCSVVPVQKGGRADQESEGNGHAESLPLRCEHCGNPEAPDDPVREYLFEGDRCLLHPRCQVEWLA